MLTLICFFSIMESDVEATEAGSWSCKAEVKYGETFKSHEEPMWNGRMVPVIKKAGLKYGFHC